MGNPAGKLVERRVGETCSQGTARALRLCDCIVGVVS